MNHKKVCKTEIDALLVELLFKDEQEENDVTHTANDDQKDEEDKNSDQDARAETRKNNQESGKKVFFRLNLTSEVSVWLNLIGQGHYGSTINIQDF